MRKSANLIVFFLFGVLVELIFVYSLQVTLPVWFILLASFSVGFLFMSYRVLADWTIFSNEMQKELLNYIVTNHFFDKMIFAFFGGAFIFLSNLYFLKNFNQVFVFGTFSTILAWFVFEILRDAWNNFFIPLQEKSMQKNGLNYVSKNENGKGVELKCLIT